MSSNKIIIIGLIILLAAFYFAFNPPVAPNVGTGMDIHEYVTKQGGTERAFDNEYWNEKRPGIYVDYNTGEALFSSLDKYESGTGWPSFTKTITNTSIQEVNDYSLGMLRTEVRTEASHLGHIFPDGPPEAGGNRYCINSAALKFVPYEELEAQGYGEYKKLFDKK